MDEQEQKNMWENLTKQAVFCKGFYLKAFFFVDTIGSEQNNKKESGMSDEWIVSVTT